MSEDRSFYGSPRTGGQSDRRAAALLVVLLAVFVGVAIAKPWGSSVEPAPSVGPARADVTSPTASLQTTAPEMPTAAPSANVALLPVAFTTPRPPPASATWRRLRWRRLAPDDPLSLVTSALQWRGGFIAVGREPRLPATPVWTSADGRHWEPLLFGTSTTFWPGLAVLGVADLPRGLVALTETVQYCGTPCPSRYIVPVISWTSPDGRRWGPHVLLPPEWLASPPDQPPLFADGPAGLVVASIGRAARLATSTDGSLWHLLPVRPFPAQFALNDLRGTATGYVAVGRLITTDSRSEAASLWSSDGRHWSEIPTILPTTPEDGLDVRSDTTSLVVGRGGVIAVGRGVTALGATLWWQSSDGRRFRALPAFPPLGPTTCTGEGCVLQPNGALVGDGQRLVVVRGGPDARAWVSSDGRSWGRISMRGDIPSEDATQATLLPGGVLLTDGSTTWFGEAMVH